MTQEQYITRAIELRGVMLPEHKTELDSILSAIWGNGADVADVKELIDMVESYEAYRQLPPEFRARFHLAL